MCHLKCATGSSACLIFLPIDMSNTHRIAKLAVAGRGGVTAIATRAPHACVVVLVVLVNGMCAGATVGFSRSSVQRNPNRKEKVSYGLCDH